jgi:hypothetical protein
MSAPDDTAADGFLSRWSRRKAAVRQGAPLPAEPPAAVSALAVATPLAGAQTPALPPRATQLPDVQVAGPAAEPAPTLDDVAALAPGADVQRFVAPGVDTGVKNAALKKLFADPHFNVMDGLDTYIDDYGRPDPLPAGMLRQMAQSAFLGLFNDADTAPAPCADTASPPAAAGVATAATTTAAPPLAPEPVPEPGAATATAPDENADLRLQPHAAAGPAGSAPGPEPHTGG